MAKKFCFVVITTPVPGKEDEFNHWYDHQHLADVLKVPGFVSAQRFKITGDNPALPGRYLALYQMETDDPEGCLQDMMSRANTPAMVLSDAMVLDAVRFNLCEFLTEAHAAGSK